jgi:amino acid adenylation domain-containing protein
MKKTAKATLLILEEFEQAGKYWSKKLWGELAEVRLPGDYPRAKQYRAANYQFMTGEDIATKLLQMSKHSHLALFVILLAAQKVLLFKLVDQEDLIVVSPVYTESNLEYNSYVVLRDILSPQSTFKNFLMQVKQTVVEGYQNEHYPIGNLVKSLDINKDKSLFRVVLLLENIHQKELVKGIGKDHKNDLIFSFRDDEGNLAAEIIYNAELFKPGTIQRWLEFYGRILSQIGDNPGLKIADIELFTGTEKEKILYGFNDTSAPYPVGQTLHRLFEAQAARLPHTVAAAQVDGEVPERAALTYSELNLKANRLARLLQEKGLGPQEIVSLVLRDGLAMAVGILGVLKAGGAYLPIDPDDPPGKMGYLLKESAVGVVILEKEMRDNRPFRHFSPEQVVTVDDESIFAGETANLGDDGRGGQPAYVIYTSGTAGQPRGVLVEHRGVLNYTYWRLKSYKYTEADVALQLLNHCFDGFNSNFYTSLLSGGTLFMIPPTRRLDFDYIKSVVQHGQVTNISLTPGLYEALLDSAADGDLAGLRFVVLAAERCPAHVVEKSKEKAPAAVLINEYGPTEATVTAAAYTGMERTGSNTAVIGQPIANTHIYVLDRCFRPLPLDIAGELCIAGQGVARGYLNSPELTHEKFKDSPFVSNERMYATGDVARWLPTGNLELLGRKDQQVKLRGFRIEPAEIENRLLALADIKEALVIDRENEGGEKYLCAYVVSERPLEPPRLRRFLAGKLADYLIPAYFVQVDSFPLTANGKVDRQALPHPEIGDEEEYTAPRTDMEKRLSAIWAEVLNREERVIGIHSNFFELGGHSLKAINLTVRIHEELNVKVQVTEIFKALTLGNLAETIEGLQEDRFTSIEVTGKQDYYDLSYAQKSLWLMAQMREDQTLYNICGGYIFIGDFDKQAFEKALTAICARHEILRTTFVFVDDEPKQKIHDPEEIGFKLDYMDLRDSGEADTEGRAAELAKEIEQTTFDLGQGPLLRATLLGSGEGTYTFLFAMHHIISDAWSKNVMVGELVALYNAFRQGQKNPLPPLNIQYRDYTAWHNGQLKGDSLKKLQDYWWNRFSGEIPVLALPLDFPRPQLKRLSGRYVAFELDGETARGLHLLSQQSGVTLFMTLLALVNTLFYCYTGQEDIVLGTVVNGREHRDLANQIGYYLNMLALRVKFSGNEGFDSLLRRVRETTLGAVEHQLYPFEMLVNDLKLKRDMTRSPLFDVMVHLENMEIGNEGRVEEMEGIQVGDYRFGADRSKFDLMFNFFETGETIYANLIYNSDLFKAGTAERMAGRFEVLVDEILKNPALLLCDLSFGEEMSIPSISPITRRMSV